MGATYVKCLTDLNRSGFSFFLVIKAALQHECLSSESLVTLGGLVTSTIPNETLHIFL